MSRSLLLLGLLAAPTARAVDAPKYDYREATLPNGLRVVTLEDHSTPIVAVHLWYHVGSKDEDPARQGFAHMFEHMMFRGTDRLGPTDHFDLVRRTGGDCNAFTAFDQTVYVQKLPANQLELALWLEAERMSFLKVDQAGFDTERKVVEEERRLGLNRPYGTALENGLKAIYKVHPYRWSPIGNIPMLRAASVAELRAFWTKYYVPNNAALVIVGDVEHAKAQALATKYFGWIPRSAEPARPTTLEPKPKAPVDVTLKEDNAPTSGVGLMFRTVPKGHPDEPALEVLANILGGGESSRLYASMVTRDQTAVIALAIAESLEQDGFLGCGAILSPIGGDIEKALKAIEAEVARIKADGVTPEELEKTRNSTLKALVTQGLTVESKAQALGEAAVIAHDLGSVNRQYEAVAKLTADDLKRLANQYLDMNSVYRLRVPRNLLGALLSRGGKEEEAKVSAAPETTPPAPGRPGVVRPTDWPEKPPLSEEIPAYVPPKTAEKVLANGLKVLVVPNDEVPYVTVRLSLSSGAWAEEKPGTASLALAMLTKGTAKHTEEDLVKELGDNAIDLTGTAAMDSSSVSIGVLPRHLERAMGLLGEVTLTPTFPAEKFQVLRKQVLTTLALSERQPDTVANREWKKRLFGDHPYAREVSGLSEDVQKLDAPTVKAWWTAHARPDRATLIVAGDVDPARAFALAEGALGSWKAEGPPPAPSIPAMPPAEPTRIYLVDRPGVQAQIRIAQRGVGYQAPNYAAARVASDYFGGSFSSRLNDAIRVKKGLTYGASGGNDPDRLAAVFAVRTFSKTESTVEAVGAVMDELKRFRDEPPSDRELATSRSSLLGQYVAERETPQAVAGDLATLAINDLPPGFQAEVLKKIAATTATDCQAFVKAHLDLDHLVIVVVGDASKLKAGLEKVAPVTVVK